MRGPFVASLPVVASNWSQVMMFLSKRTFDSVTGSMFFRSWWMNPVGRMKPVDFWMSVNTKMEHRTLAWVLVIIERAWFFSVHLDSMQQGKIDVLRKDLFHCERFRSLGLKPENSSDEPCFNVFTCFRLLYKMRSSLVPPYLCTLLPRRVSATAGYSFRKSGYPVPATRKSSTLASFLPRSIVLWNALPKEIQESNTLPKFKTRLRTHLHIWCQQSHPFKTPDDLLYSLFFN